MRAPEPHLFAGIGALRRVGAIAGGQVAIWTLSHAGDSWSFRIYAPSPRGLRRVAGIQGSEQYVASVAEVIRLAFEPPYCRPWNRNLRDFHPQTLRKAFETARTGTLEMMRKEPPPCPAS